MSTAKEGHALEKWRAIQRSKEDRPKRLLEVKENYPDMDKDDDEDDIVDERLQR